MGQLCKEQSDNNKLAGLRNTLAVLNSAPVTYVCRQKKKVMLLGLFELHVHDADEETTTQLAVADMTCREPAGPVPSRSTIAKQGCFVARAVEGL